MVIGEHINWKANDTPVQDLAALEFDDSYLPKIITRNNSTIERIAKLRIQGSVYTNNTNITCQVTQVQEELTSGVFRITTAESEPALILVQGIMFLICYSSGVSLLYLLLVMYAQLLGLLDPVTNLYVSIDRNEGPSAVITWTPPYTLRNVPILHYAVNVDVGGSMSMNVSNASIFLMHWTNIENSNNFHVAVRPVNKVGKGIAATTTTVLPVTFATTGMPQLNFPGIFETYNMHDPNYNNAFIYTAGDVQHNTEIIIPIIIVIIAIASVASNLILIAIALALYRKNINPQKKMTYILKT